MLHGREGQGVVASEGWLGTVVVPETEGKAGRIMADAIDQFLTRPHREACMPSRLWLRGAPRRHDIGEGMEWACDLCGRADHFVNDAGYTQCVHCFGLHPDDRQGW